MRANVVRAASSVTGSVVVHAVVLALLASITLPMFTVREDDTEIRVSLVEIIQRKIEPSPPEPPEPPAVVEPIPPPVVLPPPRPPAAEAPPPPQQPERISVRPARAKGSAGPARPGIYANRSGTAREAALREFAGSRESEDAVKAALAWLARHQDPDGKWDADGFAKHCPHYDKCSGASTTRLDIDPGVTALALLAFLGHGHTHQSDGVYADAVRRSLQYMASIQHSNGRFGGAHPLLMYNHSLCTLALAEAWGLTGDIALRDLVQQGVNFIADAQQNAGGWDYTAQLTGRNDTSVTGWVVMALKSAQTGGAHVPWPTIYRAVEHFDRMTLDSGEVIYADKSVGVGRRGPGMVAVGMVSRQFLGWPLDSPILRKQARILRKHLPDWRRIGSPPRGHSYYYWYYGTIAMFQCGGSDWTCWNESLRDMLIGKQCRGGHDDGSWDPEPTWIGETGGRLYATATNALTLEVYYRYLPMYRTDTNSAAASALVQAAKAPAKQMQIRATRLLRQFKGNSAEAQLTRSLSDPDPFVRLNASKALASRGSAEALNVLFQCVEHENDFIRSQALDAVGQLGDKSAIPCLIHALGDRRPFIAGKAAALLRTMTGQAFGFRADAPHNERQLAINRWRHWWNRQPRHDTQAPSETVIAGEVLGTRPDSIVLLNIGRDDHVREGDGFTVLREGRYIGWVRIAQVFKSMSAARVIPRLTLGDIRQGDRVAAVRD